MIIKRKKYREMKNEIEKLKELAYDLQHQIKAGEHGKQEHLSYDYGKYLLEGERETNKKINDELRYKIELCESMLGKVGIK